MADLTITPANVVPVVGATQKRATAGAALAGGQIAYIDPADSKAKLADADNASAAVRAGFYMVLQSGAAANQPVTLLALGDVDMGNILTRGTIYVLSDTPGGIMPAADLEAGDYVLVLGIALSGTQLRFRPLDSGVAV